MLNVMLVMCMLSLGSATTDADAPTYAELQEEIRDLRDERDRLRLENAALRKQVAELESQLASANEEEEGHEGEEEMTIREAIREGILLPGMHLRDARRAMRGATQVLLSGTREKRQRWLWKVPGEPSAQNPNGEKEWWVALVWERELVAVACVEPGGSTFLPWPTPEEE